MGDWKSKAEERLEHLVETIPDGIMFLDQDGRVLLVNSAAEKMFGIERGEIIGRAYNDPTWKLTTLDGKPFPEEEQPFVRVMQTGNPIYNIEHVHERPDGTRVIISANAAPFHDKAGAIAGVVLSLTDITKHKTAEKLLRESEERYRYLVELSPDGIAVLSKGRFVYANAAAAKLLGAEKPEDLTGEPVLKFIHPNYVAAVKEKLKQMQEGKPVGLVEEKLIRPDEQEVDVEMTSVPIVYQDKPSTLFVFRDITERKKAAEEIRESRRQVLSVLENITDALFAVDTGWRLTYINPKAEQLVNKKKEQLLYRNLWEVFPEAVPLAFYRELTRAAEKSVPVTFEEFYPPPLNKWFKVYGYPYKNGLSIYFQDITERKKAEEEREQLVKQLERERQRAEGLIKIIKRDQDILQKSLLTMPEKIPGIDFGYLYRPAAEAARVGGDFYDIFKLGDGRIGIVIGDVSSKGLEAATLSSLVKNIIRAYACGRDSAASIMARADAAVRSTSVSEIFVTVFFGILDTKSGILTYCSAGHPPGILKRKTAETSLLITSSPVIGAFAGLNYIEDETRLEKDDVLILYTNGVTKARCDSEFFGEEKLVGFVMNLKTLKAKELPQVIFDEITRCAGEKLADDVVLLAVSLGDYD